MVSTEQHVKPYHLTRPPMPWSSAYSIIADACKRARKLAPEHAAGEFSLRVLGLLPSVGRSKREDWMPALADDLDGWERLGYYLGALDGWREAEAARARGVDDRSTDLYTGAYSLAVYLTRKLSRSPSVLLQGQEVRRG